MQKFPHVMFSGNQWNHKNFSLNYCLNIAIQYMYNKFIITINFVLIKHLESYDLFASWQHCICICHQGDRLFILCMLQSIANFQYDCFLNFNSFLYVTKLQPCGGLVADVTLILDITVCCVALVIDFIY